MIAAFLDSHPDFSLDDLAAELPAFALASSKPPSGQASSDRSRLAGEDSGPPSPHDAGGLVLTLPHRDRTAGFFIARLRRG